MIAKPNEPTMEDVRREMDKMGLEIVHQIGPDLSPKEHMENLELIEQIEEQKRLEIEKNLEGS